MFRAAARHSPRLSRPIRPSTPFASSRRFLGAAAAAPKRGTWRGTAVRWGLAIGAVYWYNTSPIFAEEPAPQTIPPPPQFADSDLPTVNAVVEEKRKQAEARARQAAPEPATAPSDEKVDMTTLQEGHSQSAEDLEDEAGQQGAFNPETGEINWDCPCLGGMANGPCGEDFKTAFSCFVYSTEEPKGMDCIDKFQHMQDCFRKYPEVYGAELEDDETEETAPSIEGAEGETPTPPKSQENAPGTGQARAETSTTSSLRPGTSETSTPDATVDAETIVKPKKAVDATEANQETK